METATDTTPMLQTHADPKLSLAAEALRGKEVTGLQIFQEDHAEDDIVPSRVQDLLTEMTTDKPIGGTDMAYGEKATQHLRLWKSESPNAPVIVFVHGGSWRIGTNIDSVGSKKIPHLTAQGYTFASVNYTLIPTVQVEEQVQEIAQAISFLLQNAASLDIDPKRVILMGHSSGAHVVTLLGTDTTYLTKAGVDIGVIRGVIALDGSNYNAAAEISDCPGPVAENMIHGLGTDPKRLRTMSPTYNACAPNAGAFLLLHVQRRGDVRQAVELAAALNAAGTKVDLRVFEGQSFEGHVQMLLRLGDPSYPATLVMDSWLREHIPLL